MTATTPEEWIDSVIRLMDDPIERWRLGGEGRRYVEAFHAWDRALEPLGSILGLADERHRSMVGPQMTWLDR